MSGSFVIRIMMELTIILAIFVALMAGPLRQPFPLLGQFSSSLPRSNTSRISWSESITMTPPSSSSSSSSLRNASVSSSSNNDDNIILSEAAWLDMLKCFRLAMEKQSYDKWLPIIIIRDDNNKLLVAKQHLAKAQRTGIKRLQLFTAMIYAALNYKKNKKKNEEHDIKRDDNDRFPLWNERYWRKNNRTTIPLLMALGDVKRCDGKTFPRFGWCLLLKDTTENCTTFALPSFNVYRDAPETSLDYTSFHAHLESMYPWSKKKARAIWRGSATGHIMTDWTDLPRAQMVNFSIQYPKLLDAAFVQKANNNNMQFHLKMDPEQQAAQKLSNNHSSRFYSSWMPFQDFQKYRAVMDIDGNSWSDRFGSLLCLNSVVIKVQPSYQNYFFPELEPWVHYIPVAGNMSDLKSALRFAVSDQTARQVQAIIFRANEWCRTRLTKASMNKDIFQILNSYLRLLGGNDDENERRWQQWDELFKDYQSSMSLVELPIPRN